MKARKTENGSTYRVAVPEPSLSCPTHMSWLQGVLAERGLKAYRADVSVSDPKQRRQGNEVADWCFGTPLKLWSVAERQYVSSIDVVPPGESNATKLVSQPILSLILSPTGLMPWAWSQ